MADLTEKSLEELCKQINDQESFRIQPQRAILPPWVVEEIVTLFGQPPTEEKYHKWSARRLGLTLDEYWAKLHEL